MAFQKMAGRLVDVISGYDFLFHTLGLTAENTLTAFMKN
jgi:hypothetical protein